MRFRSVRQLKNLRGKRVLVRVDFNVAVRRGRVPPTEDLRIRRVLPTITWLIKKGARVILLTHLGRPQGRRVAKLSARPLAAALHRLLKTPVVFVPVTHGPQAGAMAEKLKNGELLLLENVRFHPGEEKNDARFARALAGLADYFVNDAFAASHRAHASVVGVTKYLPSYAGFLLETEVTNLNRLLVEPRHPFVLVMAGIKVETKLPVVRHLLPIVDTILLGGALAGRVRLRNKKLIRPVDRRGGGLDIGEKTVRLFTHVLGGARTIVWNGPLGRCEDPRYRRGTMAIARAIARATRRGAFSVVGGGDTIPMLERAGLSGAISFVSTGGGAVLEYLSGKTLPGLRPLLKT
ncbi:phosphoglycerate kinase [Candidatus Uhrbacteria bacterium]|nr:phosphoglycerate kinase [Candidatus Uhrbacteria bacterium]